MDKAEQLRLQLQALSASFRLRLQKELPELNDLARALPEHEPAPEQLQRIRDQLHKLAGSAGTFGYPQLGAKARELEQLASACLDPVSGSDPCRKPLVDGIAELALFQETEQPVALIRSGVTDRSPATNSTRVIHVLKEDVILAERMKQTLGSFGYSVVLHTSAAGLQAALADSHMDALILDTSPGTAGHGMLDHIKQHQRSRSASLPVIAISDSASFDEQLRAVRAGAQGYFTKPVDLAALESRLERCFASLQSEPFRVLVVDDDTELAERFEAVLSNADMLVEKVMDPQSLLEQLDSFQPDVILMDVSMPQVSGPELAQLIRLHDIWLRIPIVYLSAETDAVRQMAALLKAGDDFITKPISDSALVTTVYSRAQRARLVSQALARDSLTGLLKHADIKEQVEIEIERARRTRLPVSVAMIDIDHFKQVNDSHGHAVGDNVIRALANLLRQRLRKIDRLGRYGGEEFVAVLPNCPAGQAQLILDEIREAFNALSFSGAEGTFRCSFSAGISACEAPEWRPDGQLEQADARLYVAKSQGRNRVVSDR